MTKSGEAAGEVDVSTPLSPIAAGVLLLVSTACNSAPGSAPSIFESRWQVVDVGGIQPQPGNVPHLAISAAGEVTGRGGCNDFVAAARPGDTALQVTGFGSTSVSCASEQARVLEQALFELLRSDPTLLLVDDRAVLTGPTGTATLQRLDG